MINKFSSLAAIALIATVPSLASADGVAASLSASFGGSQGNVSVLPPSGAGGVITTPQSVSVAGAAGGFAVASSVATASSSGAAAGATDNEDLTPLAEVTYNGAVGAYETTVSFAPSASTIQAVAEAASTQAVLDFCNDTGFTVTQVTSDATQAFSSGSLDDTTVLFNGRDFGDEVENGDVSINNGAITITNGDITVSCAQPN